MSAGKRRPDPGRWGVQTEYVDASGTRRTVPQRSVAAVLRALGASGYAPEPTGSSGAGAVRVARCAAPPGRGWGWAAQLYAVRSASSWGMGDLGDLLTLGRWATQQGASMLLINPLHAVRPGTPQEPSPYFPSSRVFRNPLYLRVEDVAEARGSEVVARLQAEAAALNRAAVIDRDRVYALKLRALEHLWERFPGHRDFDAYCAAEGENLLRFATFCALAERHAGSWQQWPAGYRTPRSIAVRRFAARERGRIDFHRWLQWNVDTQLARAARAVPLVHDIAVGVAPDGADAWMWQDVIATGSRVGAPPDEFAPDGQDWGIAPFDPHKLRAAGFEPFRQTLRRVMRHAAGVRIDHVMGLFRLWWIPSDVRAARNGAYVRYPSRELLDIVADESVQAGAFVVGEDLGTVEEGVRPELRRRGMLSYRVLWFEAAAPARFPVQALAAITTHDLPTVAGVWTGDDIRELERSGRGVNREAESGLRLRLQRLTRLDDRAPDRLAVQRAYEQLAQAPCELVLVSLDDAACATRRPNIPGAMQRENWSLPLPRTLEQLRRDALPRSLAAAMRAR